jgi:hypothetical protein
MVTITNMNKEARNMSEHHKTYLKNVSNRVSNTALYQEFSLDPNVTYFHASY